MNKYPKTLKSKTLPMSYFNIFAIIIFLKLIFLAIFSSDYQNKLFVPFVEYFLSHLNNPWQHFYTIQVDKFPYPPLMLYILSLFYLPYHLLSLNNIILLNIFFKLPILLSDLLIVYVFIKILGGKIKKIIIFYFLSPIILYGAYLGKFQVKFMPMPAIFNQIDCVDYYVMDSWYYDHWGLGKSIFFEPIYSEHIFLNTGMVPYPEVRNPQNAFLSNFILIKHFDGDFYGPDIFIYKNKTSCSNN